MAFCSAFFLVSVLFGGCIFSFFPTVSTAIAAAVPAASNPPALISRTSAGAPDLSITAAKSLPTAAESSALLKTGKVGVEISYFDQAWLAPDADLIFSVDITNGTKQEINISEIAVNAQNTAANSQYSLYHWMNGSINAHPLFSFSSAKNIPAGEMKSIKVTVPRSEIPWRSTRFAWGPRGIEACAVLDHSKDNAEKIEGADLCDRSVTVVAPSQEINPMPLAVSLPLTLNATELSQLPNIFDSLTEDSALAESDKKAPAQFTSVDQNNATGKKTDNSSKTAAANKTDADTSDAQADFSDSGVAEAKRSENSAKGKETSSVNTDANKNTDSTPNMNSGSGSEKRGSEKKAKTPELNLNTADFPQEIQQNLSNTINRFENLAATFFIDPALLEDSQLQQEIQNLNATQNLLLPYADADLQGLIANKKTEQIEAAYTLGAELKNSKDSQEVFSAEKIAVLENIPQQSELMELANLGISTAIISGAQRSIAHEFFYTQEATQKVSVSEDNITNKTHDFTLLFSNDQITRALEGKLITYRDVNGIEIGLNDRSQIVLALSAIYFNEAPNLARPLLVQVPRNLANEHANSQQQQSLYECISALTKAPWLQNTSVTDLINTDAPLREIPNFTQSELNRGETKTAAFLEGTEINNLLAAEDSFIEKTKLFQQDTAFMNFAQRRLITAFSNSWRLNRQAQQQYFQEIFSTDALKENLKFEPSSTINMISESSALPARVHNLFNQDVRVQIALVSPDNRLSSKEIVQITLPAKQVSNIALPVKANGWGDIRVLLKILDQNGNDLGIQMNLNMRIRSSLENTVTIFFGSLFALILIYGIYRSVYNGRRAVPMSQAEIESAALFEKSD